MAERSTFSGAMNRLPITRRDTATEVGKEAKHSLVDAGMK
jgi:hypothetical protein